MRTGRLSISVLAPVLALAGVGAAALGAADASSRFAVLFVGVIGAVVTEGLVRLQRDAQARAFLRTVMFLGLAVRMFVLVGIHQTVGPYILAPDQWTYEARGLALMNFWSGVGPAPPPLGGSFQYGFPAINAFLYLIFGQARVAPAVLNALISCWTAVPVYHLALSLVRRNSAVARLAAALTVFFPSLILWSVLNIREAPTILLLASSVYFSVRLQVRGEFRSLLALVVALALMTTFREYLTLLVGIGALAGLLMGRSGSPFRGIVAGSVALVALAFAAHSLGLGSTLTQEPSLTLAQGLRRGFLFGANSAYGVGADVSTPGGALAFLPVGLAYFLLAPFPWGITSSLQAVTLPETVIWYVIFPLGIWGASLALRHDARRFTVPLAVLVAVTFSYALVEGNVGTAYRHRAQILPVVFVFCALGIRDVQAMWAGRREARERLARRARSAMPGAPPGAPPGEPPPA